LLSCFKDKLIPEYIIITGREVGLEAPFGAFGASIHAV